MKRTFLLSGLLVIYLAIQSCGAKKTEAVATPEAVITAFNAKYPGVVEVKWETEKKNDSTIFEGDFKAEGKTIKARFDENGNFLREK
jgi:ABC-type glycerol-3-phosphate transport system substrate-binding protein